jgi:hypothetical protein
VPGGTVKFSSLEKIRKISKSCIFNQETLVRRAKSFLVISSPKEAPQFIKTLMYAAGCKCFTHQVHKINEKYIILRRNYFKIKKLLFIEKRRKKSKDFYTKFRSWDLKVMSLTP